ILPRSGQVAWASAAVFAVFHIPNPILVPVTFFGGYILTRVFIAHRNLVPLAISQAVIGLMLSLVLPAGWHHGLRVGHVYYKFSTSHHELKPRRTKPTSLDADPLLRPELFRAWAARPCRRDQTPSGAACRLSA